MEVGDEEGRAEVLGEERELLLDDGELFLGEGLLFGFWRGFSESGRVSGGLGVIL